MIELIDNPEKVIAICVVPPDVDNAILTEGGDFLTTENGDYLVIE